MESLIKEATEYIDNESQPKEIAPLKKIFSKYVESIRCGSGEVVAGQGMNLAGNKPIFFAAKMNRGKPEYSSIAVFK
jgi:hypothetical protein